MNLVSDFRKVSAVGELLIRALVIFDIREWF